MSNTEVLSHEPTRGEVDIDTVSCPPVLKMNKNFGKKKIPKIHEKQPLPTIPEEVNQVSSVFAVKNMHCPGDGFGIRVMEDYYQRIED